MQYYFLYLSLPELTFGVKPEITSRQVRELCKENLTLEDRKKVEELFCLIDLYNIKALWMGQPFDDRGNFEPKELEEMLLVKDERLPLYVIEYLEMYEEEGERRQFFPALVSTLFHQERSGFLGFYYQLEREVRLILTALRAKELGKDVVHELQFEDPYDPIVFSILAQKDSTYFSAPKEYESLVEIFQQHKSDPNRLAYEVAQYQFQKIEEVEESTSFSLDRTLNYLARFGLVQEAFRYDLKEGQDSLHQWVGHG